jgi:lyso-ornithine lipid O-acyltransferase
MIATLRLTYVAVIFALITLPLLPVQYLAMRSERLLHKSLPRLWHRIIAKLLGFKIEITGELARHRPLLIVANHSSWADIVVLSSLAEVSFIAKAEVRDMPLFGWFAVLQRSIFVDRTRRSNSRQQADTIAERLMMGDAMVLFAEGTTSDGNRILPFKSTLFGAAQLALAEAHVDKVLIQPVSIAYTKVHGLPAGRYMRPISSWPGTQGMLASLSRYVREGAFDIEVRLGAPVEFTPKSSRKAVAARMESEVRAMMQTSLMRRPFAPALLIDGKTV